MDRLMPPPLLLPMPKLALRPFIPPITTKPLNAARSSNFETSSSILIDFTTRVTWSSNAGMPCQVQNGLDLITATITTNEAILSVEDLGRSRCSKYAILSERHHRASSLREAEPSLDSCFRIRPDLLQEFQFRASLSAVFNKKHACAESVSLPPAKSKQLWQPHADLAMTQRIQRRRCKKLMPKLIDSFADANVATTSVSVAAPVLAKRRHSCPRCSFTCANSTQLAGHIRTHTGEKPFCCSASGCSKRFARKEELTRHSRIHTGQRPYECDICDKRFGRKDHLNKHATIHAYRYADPVLHKSLNALFY